MTETGGPQVVWLRIGNTTNPTLFQWLEPLWVGLVGKPGWGKGWLKLASDLSTDAQAA